MTVAERCDIYGLPTCPWCGNEARVFIRSGSELVCYDHFPRHWFNRDLRVEPAGRYHTTGSPPKGPS